MSPLAPRPCQNHPVARRGRRKLPAGQGQRSSLPRRPDSTSFRLESSKLPALFWRTFPDAPTYRHPSHNPLQSAQGRKGCLQARSPLEAQLHVSRANPDSKAVSFPEKPAEALGSAAGPRSQDCWLSFCSVEETEAHERPGDKHHPACHCRSRQINEHCPPAVAGALKGKKKGGQQVTFSDMIQVNTSQTSL